MLSVSLHSPATVSRRKKELGLLGARSTTKSMLATDKRQLVLDQLAKDPAGRQGPRSIRENIIQDTGFILTRFLSRILSATLHSPVHTEILLQLRCGCMIRIDLRIVNPCPNG